MKELFLPIPSCPTYFVSENGKVFKSGKELKPLFAKARTPRVKIYNSEGKHVKIAVAKLVAEAFIANKCCYTDVVFKDRNKENIHYTNLAWVHNTHYRMFINHYVETYEELISVSLSPKQNKQVFIDPERVPIEGYPGFYISPKGILYRGDKIIQPNIKKNASPKARVWEKVDGKRKYRHLGLAKLVAHYFIENPNNHNYIIFKDRNNRNCTKENLAWVDGETFAFYSGILKGAQKRVLEREEAIRKCTDPLIRMYYKTLDESWLHDSWNQIEKRMLHPRWNEYKSECYLYFFDRAKRFSLLRDPIGLIIAYCKGVQLKLRNEISPDIPASLLWKTDESLRNIRPSKGTTSWQITNNFL